MIINGGSRCASGFFAWHLDNAEKNERVCLTEIRGLAAEDIGGCFKEMQAVAEGTRCKNWFYHLNINPCAHEHLTAEQWERAVGMIGREMGLEDQAYFVVEHEKKGRIHRHVVWSRIDVERMRAIRMDYDYEKHQRVARMLEREFGLEIGKSVLGPEREGERPERRPKSWETFRGQEKGMSVEEMKREVTELWRSFDDPQTFVSALENRGYILAKGDRRDFCLVDRYGHSHSLARRIEGVRTKEINKRLASINKQALPTVKEAAKLQKQKEHSQDREADAFKEQLDTQIKFAHTMREQEERLARHKAYVDAQAEQAKKDKARREEEEKNEKGITNASYRYAAALGDCYDVRDPYGSLAKAAMAEYSQFIRERQKLDKQIAQEKDPEKRHILELRQQIEAAEYMLITSQRIAGQSEVITGRTGPVAEEEYENAQIYAEKAIALRKEYRELVPGRAEQPQQPSTGKKQGETQKTGRTRCSSCGYGQ